MTFAMLKGHKQRGECHRDDHLMEDEEDLGAPIMNLIKQLTSLDISTFLKGIQSGFMCLICSQNL